MVQEIAKISLFHAYSIMTGSPQYLTILLIAKKNCVKVIIRRPLLGTPFEDLLPCTVSHNTDSRTKIYQKELKKYYAKY